MHELLIHGSLALVDKMHKRPKCLHFQCKILSWIQVLVKIDFVFLTLRIFQIFGFFIHMLMVLDQIIFF